MGCIGCKHLERNEIGSYCTIGMYEKYPYQLIKNCPFKVVE